MSASAPTPTTTALPSAATASRRARPGSRGELRHALARAVAGLAPGHAVLLLALDLDDFRRYNAEHGYDTGDALLAAFAGRLAAADGEAFALGADAFALLFDGTPEDLWRRGAAILWDLDPGSGGPELRCSFGAAVVAEGGSGDAAASALAVAEDRLAD